mgnify:CR=1 FL=1
MKMSSIKMFEKPLGMRDTFPEIYEKVEHVRSVGRQVLRQRGYDFVKTPTLEYYDTIGKASAIHDTRLFKLVDTQGNTLVLRPDMTTPITRLVTSKLLNEKIPQRLAYFASVFRAQQREGGRPTEFEQMGVELVGDNSYFADAEVILTAIELLKELGIQDFKLTIGHAGVLSCILKDYTESDEQAEALNQLLVERNYVGFEDAVKSFDLPKTKSDALLAFIEEALHIKEVEQIEKYMRKNEELQYMQSLLKVLEVAGYANYIAIDFTLSSHMSYYTGMLFEVFASGSGFPIGNGGRYDGLLDYFGANVGATGFGLRVDRLLEAIHWIDETEQRTVILFDEANLMTAMTTARSLWAKGQNATLQNVHEVRDLEQFKGQYDVVLQYVGEEEQA